MRTPFLPWYHQRFFGYATGTLLVLIALFMFHQVALLLSPFFDFTSALFTPLIASFLFYYLLRPAIYFCERFHIPRMVAILAIYLFLTIGFIFFVAYMGPVLSKQIAALANISVEALEQARESSRSILFRLFNVNLDYEVEQRLFSVAQQVTSVVSKNLVSFITFLTRLAAVLAVIPFVVFYLLKEGEDFSSAFLDYAPEDYRLEIRKTLHNIDTTLSNYITGLLFVSCSAGLLLFIGYLMIGLNYALILSMIALIFMTIPFLGPFLAISPAILVGLSHSPFMVLKVVIVFVIVQQCESNFISPQIIGQRLNIHPLTLILLLLAAGTFYGLAGLILATPFYAVGKLLIDNGYNMYRWHYVHSKNHFHVDNNGAEGGI